MTWGGIIATQLSCSICTSAIFGSPEIGSKGQNIQEGSARHPSLTSSSSFWRFPGRSQNRLRYSSEFWVFLSCPSNGSYPESPQREMPWGNTYHNTNNAFYLKVSFKSLKVIEQEIRNSKRGNIRWLNHLSSTLSSSWTSDLEAHFSCHCCPFANTLPNHVEALLYDGQQK